LGVRKSIQPIENLVMRCVGVVICLEQGTDCLPMVTLADSTAIPVPHISCFIYLEGFIHAFSALTLLVRRQEGHPACKKTEWWGAGVVICLEQGADLHTAQLMPLPLTVSCFTKIQIGFTFLVPAYPGSPGKRAIKWLCVCVCVLFIEA